MSFENIDFKIIKDDNDLEKEKNIDKSEKDFAKIIFEKKVKKPKFKIGFYIFFFLIISSFFLGIFYLNLSSKNSKNIISNENKKNIYENISLENKDNIQFLEIKNVTTFTTFSIEESTHTDNLSNTNTDTIIQDSSNNTTSQINTTSVEDNKKTNPYENLFLIVNNNINVTNSTPTTPTVSEKKDLSKIEEKYETKSPPQNEPIVNNQKDISLSQATSLGDYFYFNFPKIEIFIDELNDKHFKEKWIELLRFQKKAGELYEIKFFYKNQKINNAFIKKYFFKPTFIDERSVENFLNSLEDYSVLFYYTYTRKYPLIIFKIKNEVNVLSFIKLWEKESLIKDLDILYLNLPKGKPVRNYFITESYDKIDYRIVYFDNDYKLIWTLYKNNLIISTTLNGFKILIKNL